MAPPRRVRAQYVHTKAYIPLQRKKVALGPGVGLALQRHYFVLGIPTCWYPKILKFAFPPTQNPNTTQWNIGCVGSLALGVCVGHVHFIFFVLISFALGSRRKRSFQWNMGLRRRRVRHLTVGIVSLSPPFTLEGVL